MVMGWRDTFRYGMFRNCSVSYVNYAKPSYLIWTLVYTKHSFDEEVMQSLNTMMFRPKNYGISNLLAQKFRERGTEGVPW